jgi:hypothetical protein
MKNATFVEQVTVKDPDTGGNVQLEVFKHENGGMFAIDSSYLDQCFEDDTEPVIPDPFIDQIGVKNMHLVMLHE